MGVVTPKASTAPSERVRDGRGGALVQSPRRRAALRARRAPLGDAQQQQTEEAQRSPSERHPIDPHETERRVHETEQKIDHAEGEQSARAVESTAPARIGQRRRIRGTLIRGTPGRDDGTCAG